MRARCICELTELLTWIYHAMKLATDAFAHTPLNYANLHWHLLHLSCRLLQFEKDLKPNYIEFLIHQTCTHSYCVVSVLAKRWAGKSVPDMIILCRLGR